MSEIDGMEITAKIRNFLQLEAPDIAHPYICCLTSYREYAYKDQALAAGVDTFMSKPIFKGAI